MELLTESKMSKKRSIPVIGIESSDGSLKESVSDFMAEYRDDQLCRTAECAYYKAEARGFEPGHEMDDWLTAEAEVLK